MPGRASGAEALPYPPLRRDGAGVKPPDLRRAGRKILQPTLSGNHGLLHSPTPGTSSMRIRLSMRQSLFIGRFRLSPIHGLTTRCTVARHSPKPGASMPTYETAACPFRRLAPHSAAAPGKKFSVWAKSRPKRYCILKIFCYNKNRYPHWVWVSIRLASPLPSASRAHRSQQGPVSALVPLVRILRDTGRLSKTMTAAEPPARCGHSPPFGHMTAAEHRPFTQAAWYHLLHGC